MRRLIGLVLAALVGAVVLIVWPSGPKDPEAQVRKRVAEVVAGVERHDLSVLSDALAPNFRGPEGSGAQEVKQLVAAHVLRDRTNVAVFNPSLDVKLKSNDAADISGTFVFSRSKQLSAESATGAYRIDASLERRDGDWKFVTAVYEQISWP